MIKINLVPVKEKKKRQEFLIVFFVAVILLVVIAGMLFVWAKEKAVANDLSSQIKEVQDEEKPLQDKINEINDLKTKQDSLDAIKKVIGGISETQRKVLVAVDQLAANLPDGIWLTRIGQGIGNDANKYTIDGYAVSLVEMQKYVSNLQRPGGLLKEVTFDEKSTTASVTGNNSNFHLLSFEISFRVADQGT